MTELNHSIETLKYKLRISGWTLTSLAKKLQVKTSTISNVLASRTKSHRIQKLIADELETTPEQLWPERYPNNKEAVMKAHIINSGKCSSRNIN